MPPVYHRFRKSTHISMINNCVTHLRSYTNSSLISPVTPRGRQRLPSSTDIVASDDLRTIADVTAPKQTSPQTLNDECFMFHNVLRVFHNVLLMVHNVLRCITMFYTCFILFYYVFWYLASRATIGVASSATTDRLRDHDNAAGIVDIAANVIPC